MSLYELHAIRCRRGGRTVLDLPRLDIGENRITALLGPNGAGKSTLLDLLAFLSRPDAGHIVFRGRRVRQDPALLTRLRREVALLDQHPIMFTCSLRRNVEYGLRIRRVPRTRREAVVDRMLDLVGLRHLEHAWAPGLSGGETRRAALARALAVSPRVLLCDEPTAGIDAENQEVMVEILRRISQEERVTIVMATHDLSQAARLATARIVLDRGRLDRAGQENLFTGQAVDVDRCRIRPGFHVPLPGPVRQGSRVRLALDPSRLGLARPEKGLPRGQVMALRTEGEEVLVCLDMGTEVRLRLSMECYQELSPRLGQEWGLLIPSEAVRLLDPGEHRDSGQEAGAS